ncbi:nitroreductase family protein [Roseicella aerolata]|uniref:Nitroreductase family protein n=1 Tax=Roseicella aerolata TaxID=2883479 RepID=A0A9X1LDY2_9PROT|nr:nitroreductase family protein [Roseicella aerolata]MCB4825547.1 nitroreductase family protein [Roseicella aerolata]
MDGMSGKIPTQQAALAARYGAAVPPTGPWNATIAGLLDHRSVRGYRPDPLPPGTLETLVAAAQSAATSSNLQTWSVVTVEDPAARAVMAEVAGAQKHILECPLFLVFLADVSRNDRLGQAEGRALEGLPFLETFLVAAIDAALAAQNAVVAAESLGLSTVYIGALRNDPARVAETLGLPPGAVGVFGLCVGYAKAGAEGEVKPRLPQSIVLHRRRYDALGEPAARTSYDAEMRGFSQRNEMAADTWTARVIARIGTIRALRGRDRLAAALHALGFPLR